MEKMNKEFEYQGYRFNTSVEFNFRSERKPGGKVWHKVVTNDMGATNFYLTSEVEESELAATILFHEKEAKEFVDKREYKELTPLQELLTSMGFS
jgi:hypothetical protein